MRELSTEYPGTTNRATQSTFIYHGPQHWPLDPIHDPLSFQPRRDVLADLFVAVHRARSGLGIRSPTSTRPTSAAEYVIAWPNWPWDIPAATRRRPPGWPG
jgi:hypothetical protein